MTSISWDDDDGVSIGSSVMTWKGRNHFNFIAGRSKLRALPVILHLLPEDIDWFAKVSKMEYFECPLLEVKHSIECAYIFHYSIRLPVFFH